MKGEFKILLPASILIILIGIGLIYIGNWWGIALILFGGFLAYIGR